MSKTVLPDKRGSNSSFYPWIWLRRLSQLAFLFLFFIFFFKTDYSGSDQISGAVNILFRLDPYLAASVMLGVQAIEFLFLPALSVLLLTVLFSRAFCGWFCPMGTLLDISRKVFPKRNEGNDTRFPRLSLILLLFTLAASFAGWGVSGYLDPFSLLVRAMAQALYPLFNSFTVGFFTYTYTELPEAVNMVTEPIYSLLQYTVLPSSQKYFQLAYLSFLMLLAVFLLEIVQKRFFCRNLCPLGAMLGLVSRFGLISLQGGDDSCSKCRICSSVCRMGAIDQQRTVHMSTCNLCLECVVRCPQTKIEVKATLSKEGAHYSPTNSEVLSRRQFLGTVVTGLVIPQLKSVETQKKVVDPLLIRPPGAVAEEEFLARCVRCAECIQVCIGNGLQPTLLRAGLDGIFSPVLVARSGYCEFNCTLCGQVCPSGAIKVLNLEEKHRAKIGHAWFDKNTCLPFAKDVDCIVCEEHCPTPDKAIKFKMVSKRDAEGRDIQLKQPYIVDDLCIGCGICETKCPLPGKSAIYITSAGEQRNPENELVLRGASPYG